MYKGGMMEKKVERPLGTEREELYGKLRLALIVFLVVAVGLFAINQFIEFKFKSTFLQKPCNVCQEFNPNQSRCIEECFTVRRTVFSDANGNWLGYDGKCYDLSGDETACLGDHSNPNFNLQVVQPDPQT